MFRQFLFRTVFIKVTLIFLKNKLFNEKYQKQKLIDYIILFRYFLLKILLLFLPLNWLVCIQWKIVVVTNGRPLFISFPLWINCNFSYQFQITNNDLLKFWLKQSLIHWYWYVSIKISCLSVFSVIHLETLLLCRDLV